MMMFVCDVEAECYVEAIIIWKSDYSTGVVITIITCLEYPREQELR